MNNEPLEQLPDQPHEDTSSPQHLGAAERVLARRKKNGDSSIGGVGARSLSTPPLTDAQRAFIKMLEERAKEAAEAMRIFVAEQRLISRWREEQRVRIQPKIDAIEFATQSEEIMTAFYAAVVALVATPNTQRGDDPSEVNQLGEIAERVVGDSHTHKLQDSFVATTLRTHAREVAKQIKEAAKLAESGMEQESGGRDD